MNNQIRNNSLLERYTETFLEVSAQMQHHGYDWEKLMKENFPKLDILYGYFVEFDPNSNQIKYLIESDIIDKSNASFKPTFIPYFGNNYSKHPKLNQSLKVNSITNFDSILSSPKVYQHLPIQKKSNIELNYISDKYLSSYISLKIRSTNDYYVVLFEEIAFFQFAYLYKSTTNVTTADYFLGREKLLINYLIKFALSVEKNSAKELDLHKFLNIYTFDDWNTENEIVIRNLVNDIVEKNILYEGWFSGVLDLIQKIITNLLEEYKKNEDYTKLSDVEILRHISRFDIESSFLVINDESKPILHDVFIFPLYTETDTVFKTKYIQPNVELDVHSPILLVLFIKTLFEISGQKEYDETEESIKGFQLTKEIVKLFAGKIIQDDYLKSVLRKEISVPATTSAISQVFARNMSHNIGSHVSYRATNGQVKKRAKELYPKVETNKDDFATWLDYFSEKLDKYEIYRNEYLADFDQSPKFVRFYQDLVLPFCENMLVMDNIAAGEELHYKGLKNNLKIRCRIDGKEMKADYPDLICMMSDAKCKKDISYPDNFPYLLQHRDFDADQEKNSLEAAISNKEIKWKNTEGVFEKAEDVEICLHSEQAIYSILENLVRNSAKHQPKVGDNEEKQLTITLDLKTDGEDCYTLYLYDDSSKVEKELLFDSKEGKTGIYQRINESLLEDSGKPRRSNWGFADMKINSFLLWNRVDAIEDGKLAGNFKLVTIKEEGINNLTFTEVNKKIETQGDYRFGYKINLSKARKILWVGEFMSQNQAELEKQGLVVVPSLEAFTKSNDAAKNNKGDKENKKGLMAFQFVVINTDFTEGAYLANEEKLPGRIIVLKDKPVPVNGSVRIVEANSTGIYQTEMPKILAWCWEKWLIARDKVVDMYLHFDNKEVAEKWDNTKLDEALALKCMVVSKLQQQSILANDTKNIVYEHHGKAFNQKLPNGDYQIDTQKGEIEMDGEMMPTEILNFGLKHNLMFFDKSSEDFALLNYPPKEEWRKKLLIYELMDAANTNVFIVDERISDYSSNRKPSDFHEQGVTIGALGLRDKNWYMYAAGKTFVVHQICNDKSCIPIGKKLEGITMNISKESIEMSSLIKNFEGIKDVRKDVLIIHRTYLDSTKIGIDADEFLAMAKKQFGAVFITSGGGYPHNLKSSCKFMPFSVLESCVNARLSKNKLNSLIKSNVK